MNDAHGSAPGTSPHSSSANSVWENWSGTVTCRPARVARPADEAEIAALVRDAADAGRGVRVAGSGHSHTPLVATGGCLLSLEKLTGVEEVDTIAREATVRAGTVLHDLGPTLLAHGLAQENLGDVDVQSLAGALATGTHGTGRELGGLATQVRGLRLVMADGEVVDCSEEREPALFRAARVSLGALGVVTSVRLRLLAAYRLHERVWREDVGPGLARLEALVAGHRHFEFFWLPHRDRLELKTLDVTDAEPGRRPGRERVGPAHEILPSVREERFVEMEYALPAENGPACFEEVRALMRERHPDVLWPVEYRTVAADALPLSPASGRATVTLSLHQGVGLPFEACFRDAEVVLLRHGGRPHWGKWHSLGERQLRDLYPAWDDFQALRGEADPDGRFANAHLRELFGSAG